MTSRTTTGGHRNRFLGRWRIIASDLWAREDLDEVSPAHITFSARGQGELALLVIEGDVDYRLTKRGTKPVVEFSWQGSDDGHPISGRGWAALGDGDITGRLFIHQGDDTGFTAKRESLLTSRSSGRASRAAHRDRWADD
jgi:hypothetical protein